jgi:hypothetical protein
MLVRIFLLISLLVATSQLLPLEICLKQGSCLIDETKMQRLGNKEYCELCQLGMPIFKDLIRKNETASFRDIATLVCTLLNITQEEICYKAIGLFEVSNILLVLIFLLVITFF